MKKRNIEYRTPNKTIGTSKELRIVKCREPAIYDFRLMILFVDFGFRGLRRRADDG